MASNFLKKTDEVINKARKAGQLPGPYSSKFIKDILNQMKCICGSELEKGSVKYRKIESQLKYATDPNISSRANFYDEFSVNAKEIQTSFLNKIHEFDRQIRVTEQSIEQLNGEIEEIETEIGGERPEIKPIVDKLRKADQVITAAKAQIKNNQEKLTELTSKKSNKEKEYDKLFENNKEFQKLLIKINNLDILIKNISNLVEKEQFDGRSSMEKLLLKSIQNKARMSLDSVSIDKNYKITFKGDSIISSFSSGEAKFLTLFTISALINLAKRKIVEKNRYIVQPLAVAPLIIDSPFGDTDEETPELVLKLYLQILIKLFYLYLQNNMMKK